MPDVTLMLACYQGQLRRVSEGCGYGFGLARNRERERLTTIVAALMDLVEVETHLASGTRSP